MSFYAVWAKGSLIFGENFLTGCSKLHSLWPEYISEAIFSFFTKSSNLLNVFRPWGKYFVFLAKIFGLGCQNFFQVSRGDFWKKCSLKTSSLNCFILFGNRAERLRTFGDRLSPGSTKLHSLCPEEIFDWTDFSTKIYEFFHRLRALRKTFWLFGGKASKSLSKLQFMCTESVRGKFDFWKNFYIFFEYWSIILRTFGKKCWVGENFWVRLFFSSGKIHVFLRKLREKVFFVFGKNFRQVRQKGTFVPEWDFWVNCFFYEFFEFLHCFPTVGRTFCNIGAKSVEKLSKVHSTWPTNFSRKVCFLKKIFTFRNVSSFDEKLCELLSEAVPVDLKNCSLHSFRGSSSITLTFSSRNFTPTNGLWGKKIGIL